MVASGIEDVRDDIVSGSFFSLRLLQDSKRDGALGQPISVQQLSYSLNKRSTGLASSRMFFLVVE